MKKTVIALVCALVSSTSMAASLSMGTSNSHSVTAGTFSMTSGSLTTREHNPVTVTKPDGSKINSYAFDQIITDTHTQSGTTSGNSLSTTSWTSAGGTTWGSTSMTNGSSVDTIDVGFKQSDVFTEERELEAFDAQGYTLYNDTIDENTTIRTDNYTGTVTTTTSFNGIFVE